MINRTVESNWSTPSARGVEYSVTLNRKVFSCFLIFGEGESYIMKSFSLVNFVRAIALALTLGLAPFAMQALAQNSSSTTTTTQSSPATQSSSQSTTKETSTQTSKQPSTDTVSDRTTLYLVIGGIALLAIILIIVLSARGRSRGRGDTVYESKTVVKKD
jgi:beta-lactamase regulating signal transducer with metallopeptidase domain